MPFTSTQAGQPPPGYAFVQMPGMTAPALFPLSLIQGGPSTAPVALTAPTPVSIARLIGKPEKWKGEEKDFESWLKNVELYVGEMGRITERDKVVIALSYMDGHASNWAKEITDSINSLNPVIEADDWALFKKALTAAFGNPHKESDAIWQIKH